MTTIKPLAALLLSAALLIPTLGVTPAQAEETKPDHHGTITPIPRNLAQLGQARDRLQGGHRPQVDARSYPDSLTVYPQSYTRSPSGECESLLAQLDVSTGADYESGTGEWASATVEWQVPTSWGENYEYGSIYSDGSYEFDALYWCPNVDGFGTFTLSVSVTYYDLDGYQVGYDAEAQPFTVSPPPVAPVASSKVSHSKKKYRAHGWKWNVRVTRANRAWGGTQVVMQAKLCGGWQKMFTKRTNARGRAAFTADPEAGWNKQRFCGKPGARIPFRFAVAGNASTRGDVGPTFRVTRR
ncbi:hypothetical protein [Nocardioides lijunqiniae]|uniref:hypothetical protein n=1 Tax=Nocardioides lijunqiniae TaxID=2760832 RepID=UPI001877C1CC|nr:hypothetical protein [Nocardioides lijunqiniae]